MDKKHEDRPLLTEYFLTKKLAEYYGISLKAAQAIVAGKAVQKVLEILTVEDGLLDELELKIVEDKKKEIENLEAEKERIIKKDEEYQKDKIAVKEMAAKYEEALKNVNTLKEDLLELDTAEAKDRLRLYERFKADVSELDMSSQNQTAYIFGLASILAGFPAWGTVKQKNLK